MRKEEHEEEERRGGEELAMRKKNKNPTQRMWGKMRGVVFWGEGENLDIICTAASK